MTNKRNVFEEFDGVYAHSKEFPEHAKNKIPKDVYTAIDKGNECFFKNFKAVLPKTYLELVNNCKTVQLLELKSESRRLGSYGEMHYTYRWGTECNQRLLTINIPVRVKDHPLRKNTEKIYFSCLPPELICFYDTIDGMSLADNFVSIGYDFPFSYNEWRELHQYCIDMKIQYSGSEKLFTDFPGDELRVLMRGSHNDLVILNFTKKDGNLYHVHNNDFDNYRLIENPAQTLDNYFANALKGFPDEILLSQRK